MPESWAISGVDLHLDLAGTRGRAGLERALRAAVRTGRLRPGTRLPSSRALAADLRIARNTVAETYGQLVAEGWLLARQGSGTVVAERVAPPASPAAPAPPGPVARHSLKPGSPDLTSFPRTAWLAASRRALATAPADAYGYGDPRGRPELRRALADYLARARGVHADAERIVVCAGFTQALGLLCEAVRAGGARTLATEAWCQPATRELVAARGLRLATVPVDERGAVPGGEADVLLLTPAHQFPIGSVLVAERRTRAVDDRRADRRGRLRRRVPVRPAPGRRAAGARPRPGRVRGDREQDARPGAPAGLVGAAGAPGRRRGRGQGAGRPADRRAGAAGDGGVRDLAAATTGTCAGAGWRTGVAGTGWWRR